MTSISNFLKVPVNPRLEFGISLDRVCEKGVLHPGLRELFLKAYLSAGGDDYIEVEEGVDDDTLPPVMYALRPGIKGQGLVSERIKLKAKLEAGKWIVSAQTPPGAPLWLLRHFLGRLPTPLLRGSHWSMLAIACGAASRPDAEAHVAQVLDRIVAAIEAMSPEAYYTLSALVLLIRNLTMERCREGQEILHEEALEALSQYFTAAIITRPYRPGLYTTLDKEHQPLLVFLAKRWLEIKKSLRVLRSSASHKINKCSIFNTLKNTPRNEEFFENFRENVNSRRDRKEENNTNSFRLPNFSQRPRQIKEAIKVRFIRNKKVMVDKACSNLKRDSKAIHNEDKRKSYQDYFEKKMKISNPTPQHNTTGTQTFECEFPDEIPLGVPEDVLEDGSDVTSPDLRKIESCPNLHEIFSVKVPKVKDNENEPTTKSPPSKLSTEDANKFLVLLEPTFKANSSKKMLIYRLESSETVPIEVSEPSYIHFPNSEIMIDCATSSDLKMNAEKMLDKENIQKNVNKSTNTTPSYDDFVSELKSYFKANAEENRNSKVDTNGNLPVDKSHTKCAEESAKNILPTHVARLKSKSTSMQSPKSVSFFHIEKCTSLPQEPKPALFSYIRSETKAIQFQGHSVPKISKITDEEFGNKPGRKCLVPKGISILDVVKVESEKLQKATNGGNYFTVIESNLAKASSSPLPERFSVYRFDSSINNPNTSDGSFFTCSNSKLSSINYGQTPSKSQKCIENPPSYEEFAQELRKYFKETGN